MSRGPGKVERAVESALRRSSRALGRVHVEIEDVVSDAYDVPLGAKPTRAQRVAILRAMRNFVRKHGAYTLAGGKGTTRIVRLDKPISDLPRWVGRWSDQ
jgi:hypothetical protein